MYVDKFLYNSLIQIKKHFFYKIEGYMLICELRYK